MKLLSSKKNMDFYISLLVFLFVLCSIIYISSNYRSKEEFMEVHWQFSKIEDLKDTTEVSCILYNCSRSGTYKIGRAMLYKTYFNVMITDPEIPGEYDSICFDINGDNIFCQEGEKLMKIFNTFYIDSKVFQILPLGDEFVIAHYSKEVDRDNFTISYVINSHYSKTLDFKINLFVNDKLEKSEIQTIWPKQEFISNFKLSLPEKGLYKVKVEVSPEGIDENAYIDFTVELI